MNNNPYYFHYQQNILHAEQVNLIDLANTHGTPCYVYSHQALLDNWQAFNTAFGNTPHRICYAVKANSNLTILNLFAQEGAGFDIVSMGELQRVLAVNGNPQKIIFSGVAKQTAEIEFALHAGIGCFNIESEPELERIHALAKKQNKIAKIALRINPNIDAGTHPYISTGLSENKFGIHSDDILPLCHKIKNTLPYCELIGMGCHIGSQITELTPFMAAIDHLLEQVKQVEGCGITTLKHLDVGGGLGIRYYTEESPSITEYVHAIKNKLADCHCPLEIIIEPGRALVGNTGILLTRIEYIKQNGNKNFALVDGGMNDLLRPSLYDAWHPILPVIQHTAMPKKTYDIVGPVCESGDFFGKNRELAIQSGDLIAVGVVGAYGFCMSSNYNTRARPMECLIAGDNIYKIREREKITDLFAAESIITI